jgi:autotransporter translocation and assembly factor TamB
MPHWVNKSLIVAALLILVLSLGLLAALLWTPLPTVLANWAADRFLEPALGLEIDIQDVGGDLLHHFAIEGVELRSADGGRLARATIITLEYDWRDLLGQRWQLERLVLREPILYLTARAQREPVETSQRSAIGLPLGAIPELRLREVKIVGGRIIDEAGILADSLVIRLSVEVEDERAWVEIPRCSVSLPRKHLFLRGRSSDIVISSQDIHVGRLEARTPMSEVSLTGRLNLVPSPSCSLQVQADSLSLVEVGRILAQSSVPAGRIHVSGQIQGGVNGWNGWARMRGRVERYRIDRLSTGFVWGDGRLTLSELTLQSPGVDLRGGGRLHLNGRQAAFGADLVLRDVDLHAVIPQTPSTRLNGRLIMAGTGLDLGSLDAHAQLDLRSAAVAGYRFEKITGQIQYQKGTVSIPRGLVIEGQGARLFMVGSLDGQQRLDAWAQVEVQDVGRLLPNRSLAGALQARFQAQGPLRDPQVAGQVQVAGLKQGDRRMDQVRGNFGLSGAISRKEGFFALRCFDGQLGQLTVQEGRARGRLQGRSVLVDSLFLTGPHGAVTTTARLDMMEDSLRVVVDRLHGQILGTAFQTVEPLEMTYREGQMHLADARLSVGGGSLAAEAVVGPGSRVEGQLHVEGLQMEMLSDLLPGEHRLSGLTSLDVVADGSFDAPRVEAGLVWSDGRFDQVDFERFQTQLDFREDRLTIERLEAKRGDTVLHGQGHLPVDIARGRLVPDRSWDVELSGKGDRLDLVPLLVADVQRLEGPFTFEFRASGTPRQPAYAGFFQLREGTLKLAPLGNEIGKITLSAYLDGQYLVIDEISAETPIREHNLFKRLLAKLFGSKKKGRLVAHGRINLAGPAFDLSVTGKRFYVEYLPQEAEAEADLNLRVTGHERPTIAGEITVRRALIGRSMESAPKSAPPQGPPPYDLDLTVHIPKNCWVRNEAAEIEMRGEVRVTQRAETLSLLGTLNTIQGSYYFYGNGFQIDRGEVTFDRPEEINPQLDVSAWTQVDGERIDLAIGGRLRSPTVTLTSTSGYSEGDIISLLTLHQTGAGLDTLAAQEVVARQAGTFFGGYLQQAINRKTSRFLGVETFKIQPDPERRLDLSRAELTVGTYLSSQFYIEYSRRLSQESGEQVGIEYSLSENLSLQGRRDMKGLYRLGLSARWQY